MRGLITFCLVAVATLSFASDAPPPELAPVPEPPQMPKTAQDEDLNEPDITILRKEKETIQEYRRNGKLYMIKVIPDVGSPYYLLDSDGDGKLDVQRNDMDKGSNINQWQLFKWNSPWD